MQYEFNQERQSRMSKISVNRMSKIGVNRKELEAVPNDDNI